jgi:hypothetical protein
MLDAVCRGARACGLIDERPEGAVDATGYESRHVSAHYRTKLPHTKAFTVPHFPKLTVLCHTGSFLWVAAEVSQGPSNDSPDFGPTVMDGSIRVPFDRLLADAAYDSVNHHHLCREVLGIRSLVVPVNQRGSRRWPRDRYRRQLKRRFPCRVYRRRVLVESAFSQDKRTLGSALRGRSDKARAQELLMRVLTHNLMILQWLN